MAGDRPSQDIGEKSTHRLRRQSTSHKDKKYVQKFRTAWLGYSDFKSWLKSSNKCETKAYRKIFVIKSNLCL